MSAYDCFVEMFRDTDWRKRYTKKEIRELNKRISSLDSPRTRKYERIIRDIIAVFRSFYAWSTCARELTWYDRESGIRHGVADLILENRDFQMFVEVSTIPEVWNVRNHIENLTKYKKHNDATGRKRCFIGAVAGTVIDDEVAALAHENGLYVIARPGKTIELLPLPENFKVREW